MQNAYLRGCVILTARTKQRRRPRQQSGHRRSSFICTVTAGTKADKVCKASFVALHGIRDSWLVKKKILNFNFSCSIADGRGRHASHSLLDESNKQRMRDHIEEFPVRKKHYNRSKNQHYKYLDSSIKVAMMH